MKFLAHVALALVAASQVWLAAGAVAQAEVDWCGGDPPVHLILPSGQPLETNVHVEIPVGDASALSTIAASGRVVSVQGNVATVQVSVSAPDDGLGPFPVQVKASSLGSSVVTMGTSGSVPTVVTLSVMLPPGLAR